MRSSKEERQGNSQGKLEEQMDGWFLTLRGAQQQQECEQNKLHVGRWCEADGARGRFYPLLHFRVTFLEFCF